MSTTRKTPSNFAPKKRRELLHEWDRTIRLYSVYIKWLSHFASQIPHAFRVGALGFSSKGRDSGQFEALKTFTNGKKWGLLEAKGPNDIFDIGSPDLWLDSLGATNNAFILGPTPDYDTVLTAFYVLQMSQKVRVAHEIGAADRHEYFLHPASRLYGNVPHLICVGDVWAPLKKLVEVMDAMGSIHSEDTDLVHFVDSVDEAKEYLLATHQRWQNDYAGKLGFVREAPNPNTNILLERGSWDKAQLVYKRDYHRALVEFSKSQEARLRLLGFGSHLVGANGAAKDFADRAAKRGADLVLGGGPALMDEMFRAMEGMSTPDPSVQEADWQHVAGPKALCMTLSLPDEQTQDYIKFLFPNEHFGSRIHGFLAFSPFAILKKKFGFGTLFEGAVVCAHAHRMLLAGEDTPDIAMPVHPACRIGGLVPTCIAVGEAYKPLGTLITNVAQTEATLRQESGELSKLQAKGLEAFPSTFHCVDELEGMDMVLDEQVPLWGEAMRKAGLEPVIPKAAEA